MNERNKKTRTPKMQIDEKMQQEGSKNDKKIVKHRSPGVGKSRKMGAWGASWSQVGPSWRQVRHRGPLNMSQDVAQKRQEEPQEGP